MTSSAYTQYLDEDGIFTAPTVVTSLNDVPDEFRDMYEEREDQPGKHFLTDDGRALHEEMMERVTAIRTKHAERLSSADKEIEKLRAERQRNAVEAPIRLALTRAGVKDALHGAAIALLRQKHEFEVEEADDGDGHTVLARTQFGLVSVDDVVGALLDSDDGSDFRPANRVRSAEGTFSAMIAGLGRR